MTQILNLTDHIVIQVQRVDVRVRLQVIDVKEPIVMEFEGIVELGRCVSVLVFIADLEIFLAHVVVLVFGFYQRSSFVLVFHFYLNILNKDMWTA